MIMMEFTINEGVFDFDTEKKRIEKKRRELKPSLNKEGFFKKLIREYKEKLSKPRPPSLTVAERNAEMKRKRMESEELSWGND